MMNLHILLPSPHGASETIEQKENDLMTENYLVTLQISYTIKPGYFKRNE
ncbi:MAG: hypothetical protein A4E35_00817 [Methanoregula sp. PtaU1.Bin051]|nr:MAG: hypothetical protein A4E35_00817 [Methanoregula sp. PtaU1.Bin051]